MKIKQHIVLAFTNPLGNLLAVANLAMLAIGHGYFHSFHSIGKLADDLSMPATLTSFALVGSADSGLILPPMVYLQWIFIGWLARILAAPASAYARLNHFQFPASAFEKKRRRYGQQRKGERDRPEHAVRPPAVVIGEQIRKRYLEQPKDEKVQATSALPCRPPR